MVEKVELVRVGKARRAKLFYLRDRLGKSAKTKEAIGARIEDKEITIKEDLVEAPAEEVVANEEVAAVETVETPVEEVAAPVEETVVEEAPVAEEVVEEVKEEKTEETTDAE